MVKIIIVDKNNQVIGSKEREKVDPQNDICRISILWITNSKNQVLLAQRKMNKKYNPGKWGPAVGGTNEEGETYESNIYKEAEEEIGLVSQSFAQGPKFFLPMPNKRFCQSFSLNIDWSLDRFKIQEEEVEQIKWFNKDELFKGLKENPDNFTYTVRNLAKIN
ncbi:MAG: NUDIX domain-containing protein [Patescibacteria group bacterium]|jgi:isopentenyl-diphosphate delta-isomerase